MLAKDILANYNNDEEYNSWATTINNEALNFESPFAVKQKTVDGELSAIEIANSYMALKQRKPMVMEYYKKDSTSGEIVTKSITMYINPDKMTISHQKEVASVKTRGGIFYHHWGNNNPTMVLSGNTGLSGMAGIKQIEEVYMASGTLLIYNNYSVNNVYGGVVDHSLLSYSDPVDVISTVTNSNYDSSKIDEINENLSKSTSKDTNTLNNCINFLESYKNNQYLSSFLNTDLINIYNKIEKYDNTSTIPYRKFFGEILNGLNTALTNTDDDIKVGAAYELSLKKLYSDLSSEDSDSEIENTDTSTLTSMVNLNTERGKALSSYLSDIKDFNSREKQVRDILKGGFVNLTDELKDEWLPRKIIIYFESKAYIGHFDSFNYNRDALSNLITYELRFTIEKQYEFNNTNDSSTSDNNSNSISISNNNTNNNSTDNTNNNTNNNTTKNNLNLYTVVPGDTIDSISKKFYGDPNYWPEIYAENLSQIGNPNYLYPGQQFVIPELNSDYWRWVVLDNGDTLSAVSKRFYGDSSKWRTIYDANSGKISNPDWLYAKTILKVPK